MSGPVVIDGIECYAPELAYSNENFDARIFERLYKAEEKNFWFRSRNRVIRFLLGKYIAPKKGSSFLEIGCGTGYVLKGLSVFEPLKFTGSEIFLEGLRFARKRLPGVRFVQFDATRIPYEAEFDAIGAFDVIEHIEQDEKVITEVHRALKPGGIFLVTVPQHRFLWSIFDDLAFHKRRYSRKDLEGKLMKGGFQVKYISSFVCMLFPLMYISRFFKRRNRSNESSVDIQMKELELPGFINWVFGIFMRLDEMFIRLGVSLPWGGSLIVVARKAE